MMILGFVITATIAGKFLDPFTPARLVQVTTTAAVIAFFLSVLAVYGVESNDLAAPGTDKVSGSADRAGFIAALKEVWAESQARRFTIFVFISMLAYSAQDLILEPYAGLVFGLTPGQSTQLSGIQNGGVLLGMLLVAFVGSGIGGPRFGSLRGWIMTGCVASSFALLGLAVSGVVGPGWPLTATVFALGFANGMFAVSAIGSMMSLAAEGAPSREGVRMGLWGAAQAIAFGAGGFLGTVAVDLTRWLVGSPVLAYGSVFCVEALLFLVAAVLAPPRIGAGGAGADATASRSSSRISVHPGRPA
jgi:BCD family chlorophyll transporter-like MFS transporter